MDPDRLNGFGHLHIQEEIKIETSEVLSFLKQITPMKLKFII